MVERLGLGSLLVLGIINGVVFEVVLVIIKLVNVNGWFVIILKGIVLVVFGCMIRFICWVGDNWSVF